MPTDAQLTQMIRSFNRIAEKVEVLTGERGDANRSLSSLRRGELIPLASLATSLKSKQISGTPTAADYNALQQDVEAIYGAFVLLSNLLGNARLPD